MTNRTTSERCSRSELDRACVARSERTDDAATRIERRRHLTKPGIFGSWREVFTTLGIVIFVAILFVLAGADIIELLYD